MLMHEKRVSGEFFDMKNEQLAHPHAHSHPHHYIPHQLAHHQLAHQLHQPPSPPMAAALKMELYTAYAYQQQLEQQLISAGQVQAASVKASSVAAAAIAAEVLDLSRRCDSVETPRKTPSPYQTSLSLSSSSSAASPTSDVVHANGSGPISNNLLYSSQAAPQPQSGALKTTFPAGLSSLYPALYYSASGTSIKQEPHSTTTTHPTAAATITNTVAAQHKAQHKAQPTQLPVASTANLLQTFAAASAASMAAAAAAATNNASPNSTTSVAAAEKNIHVDVGNATSPKANCRASAKQPTPPSTPTSSTVSSACQPHDSGMLAQDAKSTRPFKAFPRDPLVIAANFAATDVLLDNPHVERYTEYRKRVLEQIRSNNGGARTVTNPKMRRTNSRNGSINEGSGLWSNNNSENEDRTDRVEESSDSDSHAGNEKMSQDSVSGDSVTNLYTSSTANGTNSSNPMSIGIQIKDAAYYERRRKNNAAAKKSRDRRRIKEDEIAIRAAYLERQNIELLCQIDALKTQLAAFTSKFKI